MLKLLYNHEFLAFTVVQVAFADGWVLAHRSGPGVEDDYSHRAV